MNYLFAIKTAVIIFPILSLLITGPFILYQYHKFASIEPLKTIIIYSFIFYLLCAYFLVILPLPKVDDVINNPDWMIQGIPFYFIVSFFKETPLVLSRPSTYLKTIFHPSFYVVFFNILLFVPLGMFLRYYKGYSLKKVIRSSLLLSLFFEFTQLTRLYGIYPKPYRLCDIDDLILNTIGGVVGYLFMLDLENVLPKVEKLEALAYKKGEDLDNQLKMDVYMTTALPISEAKQPNVLRNYRKRYMDNTHIVTFHNFKNPISVSLQFKNVFVGLEGEVAFAAIKNSPNAYPELANSIINSLKEKYPKVADKINNQFIKNIKDAIGFDLGGKTSDCTVITNGKPNIMASNSIMRGYDNVLQRSVDYLQTKNYGFDNIRQLQKYLNEDENPFAPGSKEKVIKVVSSAAEPFADEIVSNASQTLRKIGTSIKIGFVFGGAAVPMSSSRLYEKLNNKFMSFNGEQIIPIVRIDEPHAKILNRMGLVLILKALMGPKE